MPKKEGDFISPSASLIDIYYGGGDAVGTIGLFANPFIAFGEELYHGIRDEGNSIYKDLEGMNERMARKLQAAEKTRGTVGKPLSYAQLKDIAKLCGSVYNIKGGKNYWNYSDDWNEKNKDVYRLIREFPVNRVDPASFEETEKGVKITLKENKKGG